MVILFFVYELDCMLLELDFSSANWFFLFLVNVTFLFYHYMQCSSFWRPPIHCGSWCQCGRKRCQASAWDKL